MSSSGYIYAISATGTPLVKIGSTTNVERRLRMLQTGQPFPLQVVASVAVAEDAQRVEKQVHAFLADERRRGEWFDVPMDAEQLAALVLRAIAYLAAEEAARKKRSTDREHAAVGYVMADSVGERIRQARLRYGMSQIELARRIGISKTAMNDIESGNTPDPRASRITAIADILGVSADYVLGTGKGGATSTEKRGRGSEAKPASVAVGGG